MQIFSEKYGQNGWEVLFLERCGRVLWWVQEVVQLLMSSRFAKNREKSIGIRNYSQTGIRKNHLEGTEKVMSLLLLLGGCEQHIDVNSIN